MRFTGFSVTAVTWGGGGVSDWCFCNVLLLILVILAVTKGGGGGAHGPCYGSNQNAAETLPHPDQRVQITQISPPESPDDPDQKLSSDETPDHQNYIRKRSAWPGGARGACLASSLACSAACAMVLVMLAQQVHSILLDKQCMSNSMGVDE